MQKKILLTLVVFIVVTTVTNAQIKKGATLLGGQFGFNSQKNQSDFQNMESKSMGYNISPAFGKAIKDNLVIGGDITFSYVKNDPYNTFTQRSYNYGAGFFVRQYKNLAKDFYMFIQSRLGASYASSRTKDDIQPINEANSKGYTVEVSIYPGIAYSISKKIQLEGGLNNLGFIQYSHSKQTSGNPSFTSKGNNFSIGSSLSNYGGLTLGFRVLLN